MTKNKQPLINNNDEKIINDIIEIYEIYSNIPLEDRYKNYFDKQLKEKSKLNKSLSDKQDKQDKQKEQKSKEELASLREFKRRITEEVKKGIRK